MAGPGAAVAAPVVQNTSLEPLVTRISQIKDYRQARDSRAKEAINKQFANEISSIDYTGLTTDQTDALRNRTNALIDLNAKMIENSGGDPRKIDRKAITNAQNDIRALGERWKNFDKELSTVTKTVEMDKDNVYDKEAIRNAMISMTYDVGPDGKRRASENVKTGEAIALLDNPAFMDPDNFIKREINKMDEITTKEFETQSGIPGFGTLGFKTQQKTRIPWKLDANGDPIINPENGTKMVDIPTWGKMVVNDPNTRAKIQHFAATDGLTVNEWLHKKGLLHNATPKTIEQIIMPRMPSITSVRARQAEDVKKVFLDTVSGLLNQSPELVRNLPQSDELDEEGVPYRDATETLAPYALTKVNGKSSPFAKVYVKDGEPGTFYVRDTEDADLRAVTEAEVTNMINAAGTLNTALRGIDSYASRKGYITGQNVFNPDVNIMRDPMFMQERADLRSQTVQSRQAAQEEMSVVADEFSKKSRPALLGGDYTEFIDKMNSVLQGNIIKVPGRLGRKKIVENPSVEVDVNMFQPNTIKIKDGDEVVATVTAKEFADMIGSEDFIVREKGIKTVEEEVTEPIPEPVSPTLNLDNLGL